MPTAKELVSNKPLSGVEARAILLSDFASMLESHGLFTGQMAYSRLAYEIRLTAHFDNFTLPQTQDSVRSRRRSDSAIAADPSLAAIESAPPLVAPSPGAVFTSDELHRDIQSPNVARLEHGLPVEVSVKDADGHTTERAIQYPADYPGMESVPPTTKDVTAATRAELGLPPEPVVDAEAAARAAEGMRSDDLHT